MPRNVEGGRNELDMFGGGGGGLFTFYNYGPDGAPSNAPPTAFERGITRAPLESFGLMDVITDREQIENILNPPQFVVGPGYDDQNVFKEPPELDPTLIQDLVDEVIFGDPGALEDTTRSPVETIFNDDGTITTVIDPTLITLPPLLGDPVIEDTSGGGATASPETEGTPQPTETEETIPDYSDLVNPEFEVPEAPEGVTGIPEFYRVDEDGNVTVILDPDNPILIPPERVPGHVDTTTPGTYPESGGVIDEPEETTTTPTTSGPSIVITPPPSSAAPATPSDTATTGTDQAGQEGQQGTDTGGTGPGEGGNGGDDTGDGVDDPKGMFKDTFTPLTYNIGYAPVQLQQQIRPQQTNAMDQITRLIGRQTGMLV